MPPALHPPALIGDGGIKINSYVQITKYSTSNLQSAAVSSSMQQCKMKLLNLIMQVA